MVNTKISALPAATTAAGTDLLPIVQSGVTKQVTVGQLLNLVVAGAPGALDTLKELADAIGDDPAYGGSITAALAAKADATAVAATYVPQWQASTPYTIGQAVVNPAGLVVKAVASFTSGTSYNAANWSDPLAAIYLTSATAFGRIRRRTLPRFESTMSQLMPVPPTVSYSASLAASTISSPVEHLIGPSAELSSFSGVAALVSQVVDGITFWSSKSVGNETSPMLKSFETDAPSVDVVYLGTSAPTYRMRVNGQLVTADPVSAGNATSGHATRMKIRFPDRQWRKIELELSGMPIASVTTSAAAGAYDTVADGTLNPFRMGFIGDSYTVNGGITSIALTASRLLNVEPFVNGSGGTGYNNDQSGVNGKKIFLDRMPDLLAAGLDGIVILGGINDSTTNLTAQCQAVIDAALTAGIPAANIWIVGAWAPPNAASSAAAKRTLLQAAATSRGANYVDPYGEQWITGTGTISAPVGDGNADVYISTDATHPATPDGYIYHGVRLARSIAATSPRI